MSIAALVEGWKRKSGRNGFGGFPASGQSSFTSSVSPKVELFIDEAWQDITSKVRYSDKIRISGGRPDEASIVQRSVCRFTLNNMDGLFSPRNPSSPYYKKIGRNTRIRVSTFQNGTQRFRFHGEVSEWPIQWDVSGNNVYVSIEASGILRRLNAAQKPLKSALYRTITKETLSPVLAYWPLEDEDAASAVASGLSDKPGMIIKGVLNQGSYSGFLASSPIATVGVGSASGSVNTYTVGVPDSAGNGPYTTVRFLLNVPLAGTTNGAVLLRIKAAGEQVARWDILYLTTGSGTLRLAAYDSSGTQVSVTTDVSAAVNGKNVLVQMYLAGDFISNVPNTLSVFYDDGTSSVSASGDVIGGDINQITSITITPDKDCSGVSFGHIILQNTASISPSSQDLIDGYKDEAPETRLARLCAEENVSFVNVKPTSETNGVTLGTQTTKTLMNLLLECVDSDGGMLYESKDQLGLAYRTRNSLYNQTAQIALSYSSSDLFQVPTPIFDDQLIRNDIEVKRDGGGFAVATLTSGDMSIQDVPLGVGRYDSSVTLSLGSDAQTIDQANWRLHLGTVDEPRYPTLPIHLGRSNFTSSYDLTASVLTADIGDRLTVSGMPIFSAPDDVSVLIQGFTESIDQFEQVLDFNGAPESPYEVGEANDSNSRADTTSSSLVYAETSSSTQLTVSTNSGVVWKDDDQYNLTSNPDFETNTTGWSGSGGAISRVTSTFKTGTASLKFVPDGVTQFPSAQATSVAVVAGTSYRVSGWVLCEVTRAIDLNINWFDVGVNYLSTSTVSVSCVAGIWNYNSGNVTAPANATLAQYNMTVGNPDFPPSTHVTYGDYLRLRSTTASEFPFDVRLAGEVMTVTDISGTTSPQVFNVTRSVNSVVKDQVVGTDIALNKPTYVAL